MSEGTTVWPLPLRLAHWLNAVLTVGTLGLGTFMVLGVHEAAARFELTQTHKGLGICVLVLTLARLGMRGMLPAPKPEPAVRAAAVVAGAVHAGLYILLLVLPLSGWLMVTSTPVRVPTIVFGLFDLPYPLAPDIARYRLAHAAHVAFAVSLSALVLLHLAAALLHIWAGRDRTLARMWPRTGRA